MINPMALHSESVHCSRHFKTMAENIFSSKIKYCQSDGGYEFTKGEFKAFLDSRGIVSRILCPHTAEQNGQAERKHRHITEMRSTFPS